MSQLRCTDVPDTFREVFVSNAFCRAQVSALTAVVLDAPRSGFTAVCDQCQLTSREINHQASIPCYDWIYVIPSSAQLSGPADSTPRIRSLSSQGDLDSCGGAEDDSAVNPTARWCFSNLLPTAACLAATVIID